jgi:hypothetical protein
MKRDRDNIADGGEHLMSTRIAVTIATLLSSGVAGLAGPASAGSSTVRDAQRAACASSCPAVYQPVTCELSDGRVLTFGNRCEADVFACQNGVKIVSCVEGV